MKQLPLRITAAPDGYVRVRREGPGMPAVLRAGGGASILLDGSYTVEVIDSRRWVNVYVVGNGIYTYEDDFTTGDLSVDDRVLVPFGPSERMGVVKEVNVPRPDDLIDRGIEVKKVKSVLIEVPR